MTAEKFESACIAWLAQKQAPSDQFAQLVEQAFAVLGMFQRDLATEYEVAISTISRWAKGTARPHPLLQKQIVKSLAQRNHEALQHDHRVGRLHRR